MFALAIDAGSWVARRIGTFILILAVLWVGWLVRTQFTDLSDLESSVRYLETGAVKLQADLVALQTETVESVARLKNGATTQIAQRISTLTELIKAKESRRGDLDGVLTKLNPANQVELARLKLEIEVASQELRYLEGINKLSNDIGRRGAACETVRQRHIRKLKDFAESNARLASLDASASWVAGLNPFSQYSIERDDLEQQRKRHVESTYQLRAEYDKCVADKGKAQLGLEKAKVFSLDSPKIKVVQDELNRYTNDLRNKAGRHWLKPVLIDPIEKLFPVALVILAFAIFVPLAIRLCLFFILAPIAAKQSSIRLAPASTARAQKWVSGGTSAVSIHAEVPPDAELVVKPTYFHNAPRRCATTAKSVLNSRFVMTSLAAGMYNLTQVRADEVFIATVSSGQELLDELLQFEIGEGDAVCLRPSNLVGVIQKRDSPVQISSHWRLASLQAWLSMQLRYLVFHGPVTIILKGGRGVRIEPAEDGKSIEQASTLGFSAHLNYSTSRTETAMAYLTGKKGLLRDSFSGQSGYFLFEEMPDPSKRSGSRGKGLEVVFEAVQKVFGI